MDEVTAKSKAIDWANRMATRLWKKATRKGLQKASMITHGLCQKIAQEYLLEGKKLSECEEAIFQIASGSTVSEPAEKLRSPASPGVNLTRGKVPRRGGIFN